MNWTQVDIYTTTDGIDLLCSDLMDLGIRGFSIQDAEDFNEFLQNKDGKWDYIDEDLMGLSHCESCVTIYLPEDAQGAETLQMVQELLKRKKAADTEGKFGRLEAVLTGVKEEDWANNWKQYFKPFPKSCISVQAGSMTNQKQAEPCWKSTRKAALERDSIILPVCVWN